MVVIRDGDLREECGVFGNYGVPHAASLTYYGLHALQHRGQEGAGIVSVDESGTFRRIKGGGLVTEVFDEAKLATLKGSTAIGHVRKHVFHAGAAIGGHGVDEDLIEVVDLRLHVGAAFLCQGRIVGGEALVLTGGDFGLHRAVGVGRGIVRG